MTFTIENLLRWELCSYLNGGANTRNAIQLSDKQCYELAQEAHDHSLDAFFYRMAQKHSFHEQMPRELSLLCEQRVLKHLNLLHQQRQAMMEITWLMNDLRRQILPVKGGAMIRNHPGFQEDRQFGDLDLLVRDSCLNSVCRILYSNGYRQDPYRSKTDKKYARLIHPHLPPFRRGSVTIEVHTHLIPGEPPAFSPDFLEATRQMPQKPFALMYPHPVFHLLFLLMHLLKHTERNPAPLRLHRDIVMLALHHPHTWSQVDVWSRRYKWEAHIQAAKKMVADTYQWPASPTIPLKRKGDLRINAQPIQQTLQRLPHMGARFYWLMGLVFPAREYVEYHHGIDTRKGLARYYLKRLIKAMKRLFTF